MPWNPSAAQGTEPLIDLIIDEGRASLHASLVGLFGSIKAFTFMM